MLGRLLVVSSALLSGRPRRRPQVGPPRIATVGAWGHGVRVWGGLGSGGATQDRHCGGVGACHRV